MKLLERIFAEPELRAAPPVLLDVGAAGGINRAWRQIAQYSIGVGFEPDSREAAPLDAARGMFARWIFCRALAVPEKTVDGKAALHLTQSPQCSSVLSPDSEALSEWAFSDFFRIVETRSLPATTLRDALAAENIDRVDWLKCDTQGLDLRLFRSLPTEWRARMQAVEFEPGLMDAYHGEDRLTDVLMAMVNEPFWMSDLDVGRTARGRSELLRKYLGSAGVKWVRRLGPLAPGWANVRFLRDVAIRSESLDRRAYLLNWVFAMITNQDAQALTVAALGRERFGGEIFESMATASVRSLRWRMVCNAPAFLWRRYARC